MAGPEVSFLDRHGPLLLLVGVCSGLCTCGACASLLCIWATLQAPRWLLALIVTFAAIIFVRLRRQAPCGFHWQGGDRLHVSVSEPHESGDEVMLDEVVFVHGLLSGGSMWDLMVQKLHSQFRTCRFLCPDLLGWGKSPWPCGAENYTLEMQCHWILRDVLDVQGGRWSAAGDDAESLEVARKKARKRKRRIHFVGHSMGAPIAAKLAADLCSHGAAGTEALELGSLTVVSMPYFSTQEQADFELSQQPVALFFLAWPWTTWLLCSALCQQRWFWGAWGRQLAKCAQYLFPCEWSSLYCSAVDNFFLHSCESFTQCLHMTLHATEQMRAAAAALNASRVPLSVIHGRRDGMVPLRYAQSFAESCGAVLTIIEEGTHAVIYEDMTETCEAIRTTLQRALGKVGAEISSTSVVAVAARR